MEWYYAKDGKQEGPIGMAQLSQLAASGRLGPKDMVFKTGTTDWVEASTVAGLFPVAPPAVEASFALAEEKGAGAPARSQQARARVERDEDEPRPRFKRAGDDNAIVDMLMFKKMFTPMLILILFWVGVALGILYGLLAVFSGLSLGGAGILIALGGLLSIPVTILVVRLYCEMMFVILRMNETLTEIKNVLDRQHDK